MDFTCCYKSVSKHDSSSCHKHQSVICDVKTSNATFYKNFDRLKEKQNMMFWQLLDDQNVKKITI